MSTIINADTSDGLKFTSDTSGEIKLQSAGADIATVSSTGIAMASGKTISGSGAGGKILQVVSTTKTDTFSTSTTGSYLDITGMSASITPSSTSSKILVIFNGNASGQSGTNGFHLQLVRGSTAICVGDTVAGKVDSSTGGPSPDSNWSLSCGINYLDSPSTTSATTYKIQCRIGAGNFYFNRSQSDGAGALRAASTITLMEVAG